MRMVKTVLSWHEFQDQQVDRSLSDVDSAYRHESTSRRLWALADELITEKHFLNVVANYPCDAKFRLLDIGCGTGNLIFKLANHFSKAEFYGVDSNVLSIERASRRKSERCSFVNGGFEISLELGMFDFIVCSEVFEHVDDSNGLLDYIYRALYPGGRLSISTPSGWMYRTPRLYNLFKFLSNPKRFYQLYLHPERNWELALPIHPAVSARWFKNFIKRHGFRLIGRQSALWLWYEFGVMIRIARKFERISPVRSAQTFYHAACFMDAIMNLVSLFRIFESRMIFLVEKETPSVSNS